MNELKGLTKGLGMGFGNMPRSFKLMLSRTLVVSVQELGNLMEYKDPNDPAQLQLTATEILKTTLVDTLTGELGDIKTILIIF
jgi:hypothetical protein